MLYTLQFRSEIINLNNTKTCSVCLKEKWLLLFLKVKKNYSENYTTHNTDYLKCETPVPNFVDVY
jgi:hypothetical protein